jgi:hypothetical protein
MSANGQLVFTDVDKVTFKGVGNTSNAVIDTLTGKIGVGIDSPDANLHVVGNCYVSTNFELGGTMTMGTVTVEAQHELSAITATGNVTPHTIQFTNPETAFTTTGNVSVGGDISISSNLKMNDVVFINATGERAVAVGYQAGETGQGVNTVAVGYQAGQTSQTRFATAVGNLAGQTSQSDSAVAIGGQAGQTSQGAYSVAVGQLAGASSQQGRATAVGYLAGNSTQGQDATAIGYQAGKTSQSTKAVAVGVEAGKTDQGVNAIAVGYLAGETDQGDNSIILNATGVALDSTTASSFHVKPVRGGNYAASALAYTGDGEIVEETNMHFDTAGNVGIGTTSPDASLHVAGTGAIVVPSGTTAQQPTGVTGMIRFNTGVGKLEFYNGTLWSFISGVNATGGTITEVSGYKIHTFTTSDTFTVISGGEIEYLVVAGGGGGGGSYEGGGGGAGGLMTGTVSINPGSYYITRGAGGVGGRNVSAPAQGNNSSFSGFVALGGGVGGQYSPAQNATGGGSGGGGTHTQTTPGTATGSGQFGNTGGIGYQSTLAGAGGGGAGAVGQNSAGSGMAATSGNGGVGLTYFGSYYAGGGGGGSRGSTHGTGGTGGGGNGGTAGQNGTANTGGGGGGGSGGAGAGAGGDGGSGIVIIRYL